MMILHPIYAGTGCARRRRTRCLCCFL